MNAMNGIIWSRAFERAKLQPFKILQTERDVDLLDVGETIWEKESERERDREGETFIYLRPPPQKMSKRIIFEEESIYTVFKGRTEKNEEAHERRVAKGKDAIYISLRYFSLL